MPEKKKTTRKVVAACVACREKKIKCDGSRPCMPCRRRGDALGECRDHIPIKRQSSRGTRRLRAGLVKELDLRMHDTTSPSSSSADSSVVSDSPVLAMPPRTSCPTTMDMLVFPVQPVAFPGTYPFEIVSHFPSFPPVHLLRPPLMGVTPSPTVSTAQYFA